MTDGTVKWFNSEKGYGFIRPDQGGPDAFVHVSVLAIAGLSELRPGQKVSYELITHRRGDKSSAVNVRVSQN
jgi:CspA family cold shock protein